jgi:hypothetical protein
MEAGRVSGSLRAYVRRMERFGGMADGGEVS